MPKLQAPTTRKQIRRSVAADLLGVCPRTVSRYAEQKLLQEVRRNSRLTVYYEDEVLRIQREGIPAKETV